MAISVNLYKRKHLGSTSCHLHKAEAWGLEEAMLWPSEMGITTVSIEPDCQQVVDHILGTSSPLSLIVSSILYYKHLLRDNICR